MKHSNSQKKLLVGAQTLKIENSVALACSSVDMNMIMQLRFDYAVALRLRLRNDSSLFMCMLAACSGSPPQRSTFSSYYAIVIVCISVEHCGVSLSELRRAKVAKTSPVHYQITFMHVCS